MNKSAALVALSRGLLDHTTQDEIEAVLEHEMSHPHLEERIATLENTQ